MKTLLTLCLAAAACAVFAIPAKQARVDLYVINKAKVPTLKVADKGNTAFTSLPNWMKQKDRVGANAIFNFKGNDWQTFKVTFEVAGDGRAEFRLMGPDVRDANKKNVPANVDVQKFTVNGKVLYDGKDKFMTVWHNTWKGNIFTVPVKNGDKLAFELVCRPSAK